LVYLFHLYQHNQLYQVHYPTPFYD
jgi:hypothetical protein